MRWIIAAVLVLAISTDVAATDFSHPEYLSGVTKPDITPVPEFVRRKAMRELEAERRFRAWCYESSTFRMLNSDCPKETYGRK